MRVALQLEKNKQSATDCCMPQLSPETYVCCLRLCVCVFVFVFMLMPPPISQALCNWQNQQQPEDEAITSTCNVQRATGNKQNDADAGHLEPGVCCPYRLQPTGSCGVWQFGGSNRLCHMASALSLRLSSCCSCSCQRRCHSSISAAAYHGIVALQRLVTPRCGSHAA